MTLDIRPIYCTSHDCWVAISIRMEWSKSLQSLYLYISLDGRSSNSYNQNLLLKNIDIPLKQVEQASTCTLRLPLGSLTHAFRAV